MMDKKLVLAPRWCLLFPLWSCLVVSRLFRLRKGSDSALSTSELPYKVVCLFVNHVKSLSKLGMELKAELNLGHGERQLLLPNSVINCSQDWLALRIRNLCFGKKFGIRKPRVKMLISFRTEIQRISRCASDFLNRRAAFYFTCSFISCGGTLGL